MHVYMYMQLFEVKASSDEFKQWLDCQSEFLNLALSDLPPNGITKFPDFSTTLHCKKNSDFPWRFSDCDSPESDTTGKTWFLMVYQFIL